MLKNLKITHNKFAIGVTTFLRDEALYILLDSILKYYSDTKIYIADQSGDVSPFKQTLYQGLQNIGHEIYFLDKDCGISYARRYLLQNSQEPLLVFMQDDFIVTENTDLHLMADFLNNNLDIAIVGGTVLPGVKGSYPLYKMFKLDDKIIYMPLEYLLKIQATSWQQYENINFIQTDIMPDFTMWRKELYETFDINVKTIEHSHTYLRAKERNLKIVYIPTVAIKHSHKQNNEEYDKFRKRRIDVEYLKNYWGITDFIKLDLNSIATIAEKVSTLDNWDTFLEPFIITANLATEPSTNIEDIKKNLASAVSDESVPATTILDFLKEATSILDFWLLKDTCFYAIKYKNVAMKKNLYLGVANEQTSQKLLKLQADKYSNLQLFITIEPHRATKSISVQDLRLKVHMPVITYLKSLNTNE